MSERDQYEKLETVNDFSRETINEMENLQNMIRTALNSLPDDVLEMRGIQSDDSNATVYDALSEFDGLMDEFQSFGADEYDAKYLKANERSFKQWALENKDTIGHDASSHLSRVGVQLRKVSQRLRMDHQNFFKSHSNIDKEGIRSRVKSRLDDEQY